MSREQILEQLLQNPRISCPGRGYTRGQKFLYSGFATLDQLIGGGWPLGVLTEILLDTPGIGELGLVMPALVRLCPALSHAQQHESHVMQDAGIDQSRWCAFIAPPHIPYAPAFARHGLDIEKLLVSHPATTADTLWVTEQALRSGIFAAVCSWMAGSDRNALRRLQLATETSMSWSVIFRPVRLAADPSPAALRIRLEAGNWDTRLHILRNRYGPLGSLSLRC